MAMEMAQQPIESKNVCYDYDSLRLGLLQIMSHDRLGLSKLALSSHKTCEGCGSSRIHWNTWCFDHQKYQQLGNFSRMENLLVNGWTGFWEHVFFFTRFFNHGSPWNTGGSCRFSHLSWVLPLVQRPRSSHTVVMDWLERDGSTLRASSHLNCYKYHFWWENHHFWWENSLFQWPFSIAMLVYQRVHGFMDDFDGLWFID